MKKIFFLFLIMILSSCNNDDNGSNRKYKYTMECIANSDEPVTLIYPSQDVPYTFTQKIIKKYHKETIYTLKKSIDISAKCEDRNTLITLKLYNATNKLIKEGSNNNRVNIEYR